MNRNRNPLVITAAILFALGALVAYFSGFYIDWLWFKSVDFTTVWSTVLVTKIQLFLIVGLITSLVISLNIFLAYQRRPLYVPTSIEVSGLERLRAQVEPIRRWVFLGIVLALAYFGGTSGMVFWREWMLFKNSTEFGVKDPQFGLTQMSMQLFLPKQFSLPLQLSAQFSSLQISSAVHGCFQLPEPHSLLSHRF